MGQMVSMLGAASRGERKAMRRRGALLGAAICGLVLALGTGVAQAAAPTVDSPFSQNIGASSANVGANVDPGGAETTVHVDYGTTDAYGSSTAAQTATDPNFLFFDLTGLDPNTTYHWRLVAENADGSTDSGDQTFSTLPPPSVSNATSTNVDFDRATLKAQIDPGGTNTTYYFEYGTTTAYGSTAPAPAPGTALASPTQAQTVSATITGLAETTTYHWRVVAINDSGTTTGDDHTFRTFASNPGADTLPDGRVYELVSPFDTVGADLFAAAGWPDGDHAMMRSLGTFADQVNGVVGEYVSARTPNGWDTRTLSQPNVADAGVFMLGAGEDMSHVYVQTIGGLLNSSSDLHERLADGSHRELVPLAGAGGTSYVGNSDDGSAVFVSQGAGAPLVPEDNHTSGSLLYRFRNGTPEIAGLLNANDVPACGASLASGGFGPISLLQTGISRDGNSYVFQSPDPASGCPETPDLYLRRNGQSLNISSPDAPATDQPATFLGGDQNLAKVFFSTTASLEPSDTNQAVDIYEYDAASGDHTRITSAADPAEAAAIDQTLVSPDGTHVYFTTNNVFDGHGTENAQNLWVWHDGGLTFIRTMNDRITLASSFGGASTTPDGRFLLFMSTESLTGFDNTGANGQRVAEIFRYSQSANDFACVSCNPAGGTPSSQPVLGVSTNPSFPNARAMSDDGRYIVFNSADRLVPTDRNGKQDVYRWHDGNIALISSGHSDQDSLAENIGASGRDIFFTSIDRLTPGIGQDNIKLFDARIGGGLPAPIGPAPVKHCSGDGCQGTASPPPAASSPTSATFQGSGNSKDVDSEPDQTRLTVARISKAAIARWAKTGKLSLRVTVGARGKVTARATATLPRHKKASRIASASRTAKKAGTVTLSLKLSKTSRAALRKRSLKVRLVVNSAGAAGPKTTNLTLKRQRGSARGAAAAAAARNYGPTRG